STSFATRSPARSRNARSRRSRRAPENRSSMHPRLLTVPGFDLLGRHIGPLTLHTYGVLLAVAFIAGLWVASRQAKKSGLDAARVTDMAVYVLIAGLVGAKVLLIAVEWSYYARNPREILSILQSGGVFYGGLL